MSAIATPISTARTTTASPSFRGGGAFSLARRRIADEGTTSNVAAGRDGGSGSTDFGGGSAACRLGMLPLVAIGETGGFELTWLALDVPAVGGCEWVETVGSPGTELEFAL